MPSETILWACEMCGGLFEDKKNAETCEESHAKANMLEIVEVKFDEGDGAFPSGILIESGGGGAVYERTRTGSIEDFDPANGGW